MSSQKALVLKSKQGVFSVEERDIPKLDAGEILVKVKATALNAVEWKIQTLGLIVQNYPVIFGLDIAGDVELLGEGVEGFTVGERVLFQAQHFEWDYSGYQQYAKVRVEYAVKFPDSFTYSQASSIPIGLATAAIGLFNDAKLTMPFGEFQGVGLNPTLDKDVQFTNEAVLVIGGSSSVGQYAIQLLKLFGFSTIVTTASGHHVDHLKSLGATHVIDRTKVSAKDLPLEVQKIVNAPLKIALDAVSSQETQEAGYASIADGGKLVILLPPEIKNPVATKTISRTWGNVHHPANAPFATLLFKNLVQYLKDGTIVPNKTEDLPNGLLGVQGGLDRIRKGEVSGTKLVALPQETL